MNAADGADFVNRDDVRMVEGARGFGFVAKAFEPGLVLRVFTRKQFQGYAAFELRVARGINFAHAADSDARDDFIATEFRAVLNCANRRCRSFCIRRNRR